MPYAIHADQAGSAATASVATQYGTPECPLGYARFTDASLPAGAIGCRRGGDEMVRVGSGSTAFWIDRYEASVWSDVDGTGTRYGASSDDFPASFPDNGQWTAPLYAVSRTGVLPTSYITWFQASEACRASGERLMTSDEWFAASRGTSDPGSSNGAGGVCNTLSTVHRVTGIGTLCQSSAGVQDMIGNYWEWTNEWCPSTGGGGTAPWPPGFNDDGAENVGSSSITPPRGFVTGLPPPMVRGGGFDYGVRAGIFAMGLNGGPSMPDMNVTLRCVRLR